MEIIIAYIGLGLIIFGILTYKQKNFYKNINPKPTLYLNRVFKFFVLILLFWPLFLIHDIMCKLGGGSTRYL